MTTLGLKEIGKFVWKMEKKWYYEKWVGRHASFPPRRSVKSVQQSRKQTLRAYCPNVNCGAVFSPRIPEYLAGSALIRLSMTSILSEFKQVPFTRITTYE